MSEINNLNVFNEWADWASKNTSVSNFSTSPPKKWQNKRKTEVYLRIFFDLKYNSTKQRVSTLIERLYSENKFAGYRVDCHEYYNCYVVDYDADPNILDDTINRYDKDESNFFIKLIGNLILENEELKDILSKEFEKETKNDKD